MTITFVGAGTAQTSDGSTSMTVPPHDDAADDQLHLLLASWRRSGSTDNDDIIPEIDGWYILAFNSVNLTSDTLYQYVYYRIGSPETVKFPLLNFQVEAGAAVQVHYSTDEDFWNLLATWGDDTTSGANISITGDSFTDISPETGDVLLAFVVLESTSGTISADTLAESGLTFGTVNLRDDTSQSTNLRIRTVDAVVSAGSTTADPSYSHTNASSNTGGAIFVQITDFDLPAGSIYRRSRNRTAFAGSGVTEMIGVAPRFQDEHNLHIAYVGLKPFSAIPEPAPGWTLLASATNGNTTSGDDSGSVQIVAYYRFGIIEHAIDIFANGPFIRFPVDTTTVYGIVIETFFTNPASPWALPVAQTGVDSTNDANYSATASGQLGAVVGDLIQAFTFVNTDAGSPSSRSLTISGLTLSSLETWVGVDITSGHDAGITLVQASVISGTEAGAPVFTYTNASSSSGGTIFVKLHVNPEITFSAAAPAEGFSTTDGRYVLTASNVFPYYDTFSIVRISETGNYEPEFVYAAALAETPLEVNDWTFHYAARDSNDVETFHYQLDLYIGSNKVGEVLSNAVTPHSDRLADPLYALEAPYDPAPGTFIKLPTSDVCWPVTIGEFNGYDLEGRILGEYNILGNPYPVVITDVMSASSGSFSIIVYHDPKHVGHDSTMTTIKELREFFESGQPLYFQTVWPWMAGIYDFHFVVRSLRVNRLNRVVHLQDDETRSPVFEVEVDFIETETIEEQGIIAPLTWDSLAENYGLWQNMSQANTTWLDVLNDG